MAIKGEKAACGGCAHFPIKKALQAGGKAQCPIYGTERGYNYPATVFYEPAHDIIERREMVKKFKAVQQQENKQ